MNDENRAAGTNAVTPIGEVTAVNAHSVTLPAGDPAEDYGQNPKTLRDVGEIDEPKGPA